ncbi:MAG: AmmeMemoRadiSam system protein B [Thermoanaerobaculaceae bacterium]|nr:AmmeMemoRadiSam system protein B [Thermoanaerobaculaceae bacterium]
MRSGAPVLGLLVGVLMATKMVGAEVRPAAVAGSFYAGDAAQLQRDVTGYLRGGGEAGPPPAALIAPHAGYAFSGATAGRAFAPLAGAKLTRVILLGPSHQADFRGGALPAAGVAAFATPLGEVPVDRAAVAALARWPEFNGPARAHDREHCLEVELPFLQATVGAVPIVPILVGHSTDRALSLAMARRLAELVGPGTLVVASSDFTHHGAPYGYGPFPQDRSLPAALVALARATAGRAAAADPRGFAQQIEASGDTVCGARPITVLLELLAHAFRGAGTVVDVTTSAAVSGDLSQVVAYAAVDFTGSWGAWREDPPPPRLATLDAVERKAALALARAALATHLTHAGQLADWFAANAVAGNLAAPAGVFVTVNNRGAKARARGRLRGCIGTMEAREPLADAIVDAAVSAAHDPRFPALAASELPEEAIEVSVLSPMHDVAGPDDIILGTHGVLLSKGGRQAVFLPQVATETGWDLPTFLSALAQKAGMAPDAWRSGARFEVFTAQVFGEE